MATEKIERIISNDALSDFAQLKELADANVASFEKLVAAGVELNNSLGKAKSFKEYNDEITKLKNNETDLTAKVNELAAALEALKKKQNESAGSTSALEKAKKKLADTYSAEGRELSQVREQQILASAANKKSAQETLGLVDAYKKLEGEYKKASREAQNLTIQYGANSKEAQEAVAVAVKLDAQLKEADYSIGKYNRNVGNYGNALKTLESYLADVRKELSATKQAAGTGLSISIPTGPAAAAGRTSTGPLRNNDAATQQMVKYGKATGDTAQKVENLGKQEQLLARIVESQVAGYASATAEIKANEKALQALGAAGLQNTAFYKALLKDTAELKDSVGDLKAEILALSSDTRQFDLVAGAVTGLVDAIQIGVGVSALFGDQTEDVQKSIQTLTAIQAISTGVQQLANELTTKGTALNKLYNFVIGEGAAAREADTAATVVNTVATEANAGAQEAAAVATTGLTTATKVLRGALAASGIGLLIAGIIFLVNKLQEWKNADVDLIKRQTELNQTTLETLRINKEIAELTRTDVGTDVQVLKNKIAVNQSYGKSQGEVLAAEQALLKSRQDVANIKFFETGGAGFLGRLQTDLESAAKAYEDFINQQAQLSKSAKLPDDKFNAQKSLLQSNLDLVKENYTTQKQIVDDYYNFNNDAISKQLQIDRLAADERRKFALASATISANTVIDSNQRILDDERTTLAQRLALQQSTLEQQKKLARANEANVRNDPGASPKDKQIAAKTLQYELNKIEKDGLVLQYKTREEYRKRDQQAEFESARAVIDSRVAVNEEIKNNENKSLEDRLIAGYENLGAQLAIINEERRLKLDAKGLTVKEEKAIQDEADAQALQARVKFSQDSNAIVIQSLKKDGDDRLAIADIQNSEATIALNKQLADGVISYEKYNKELLKLQINYGNAGLAIQIGNLQDLIAEYQTQGKSTLQLEADLASKQKEISDNLTAVKLENLEKVKERQHEIASELTDLFVAIEEQSIEREQAEIERQLADIDLRKERETDFVNQTVTDEQARADAIGVINLKAQRDKEVLAERQKKLDQASARTQQLIAASKIIGDTATAVFKLSADAAAARAQAALLLSNPLTAAYAPIATAAAVSISAQVPFVVGLGAIQLAKALGTKAYRYGGVTDAETILVGDGYQSEYGVTKSGKLFETPAVPTLMNAEIGTTIYPNKKSLEAGILNNNYMVPVRDSSASMFVQMTNSLGGKLDHVAKTIARKKEVHIHPRKDGWAAISRTPGTDNEYLNRNLS